MFASNKGAFRALGLATHQKESKLNAETRAFFSKHVAAQQPVIGKTPSANLKLSYRKVLELSAVATLVFLTAAAQLGKQVSFDATAVEKVDIQIEVADIPQTEQIHRPPPPPKPSVPLPSESEDIPEDLTIASTDIDFSDLPDAPAPPEDDGDVPIFIAYDEAPKIVGGMAALSKKLRYPRIAQASGVEGVVFVKVLVGIDGVTERAEIIKATPANMGFEESAKTALSKVRWHPAKQRERNIRVWVSIPVQFKLVSS